MSSGLEGQEMMMSIGSTFLNGFLAIMNVSCNTLLGKKKKLIKIVKFGVSFHSVKT